MSAEADSGDKWTVRRTISVMEDALTGQVLVDETLCEECNELKELDKESATHVIRSSCLPCSTKLVKHTRFGYPTKNVRPFSIHERWMRSRDERRARCKRPSCRFVR